MLKFTGKYQALTLTGLVRDLLAHLNTACPGAVDGE